MTTETMTLDAEQRIAQLTNELCPNWQRPNAQLEAWALDTAKRQVEHATCNWGHCHEPADLFEQTIHDGVVVETRPFCTRHSTLSLTTRGFAS